jgi:hypothetical protein
MAKTFKDLLSSGSTVQKPLFERDFFDMTEEIHLPTLPLTTPATPPVEDAVIPDLEANTTSQQALASNNPEAEKEATPLVVLGKPSKKNKKKASTPGNTPQPGILPLLVPTTSASKPVGSRNVRQTFVLEESYLEQIRDYVHARRSQGDYQYSQKQLLEEALDLWLASQNPVPPRPAELREQEQQLRVRIQQGRQASVLPKPGAEQAKAFPEVNDGK